MTSGENEAVILETMAKSYLIYLLIYVVCLIDHAHVALDPKHLQGSS